MQPRRDAVSQRKYYEIVYDRPNGRWVFRLQGSRDAIRVGSTKAEVVQAAIPICNNQFCSLRIHLENGQFEEERTYGKDPYPPRG